MRIILPLIALLLTFSLQPVRGQTVHEFMDLQTHCTMHMAYGFFGDGLAWTDPKSPPQLSWKHMFSNVNYADYLAGNKGARILVNGAILPEVRLSKKKSRRKVLAQLRYVEAFVAEHPDKFALARSPREVRELVHETDKTIFIHSIEGGKCLINGPEDARFWADQGVAFITLVHLIDDEFGGAAIAPAFVTRVINFKAGVRRIFKRKSEKGLTEKGRNAIRWLADAGILTDLTHMNDQTRSDALNFMEAEEIPPLVTHDLFKPIQNHPRGIPAGEIRQIYSMGGFVSLPISGESCMAFQADENYAQTLKNLEGHCPGSIDSYRFTYESLKSFLENPEPEIELMPSQSFSGGNDFTGENLAIGFQSDFNGWLNHHRPRVGEEGCFEKDPGTQYRQIEVSGMPHPGLLEDHWQWLEDQHVDLDPIRRASESFLQIWEKVRGER